MNILLSILLHFTLLYHNSGAIVTKSHTGNAFETDTISRKKAKQVVTFPTPTVAKLFYVQRDPNSNTIIYDLNQDASGHLDSENPIHPYWIKYNEKGQKEELNLIQRKFAYGLVTKPLGNNKFDVRFVSYKKYPLLLMRSATDNKYHVYATIAKKQIVLSRIFLKIEGGSFWLPNVVYAEIKGIDPETGKEMIERFKP